MFNYQPGKTLAYCAIAMLTSAFCTVSDVRAEGAKNQADVDATKLSKDDNQHQLKPAKNIYKKGTPLPFEGPPAKSGATDDKSTSATSSANKKE